MWEVNNEWRTLFRKYVEEIGSYIPKRRPFASGIHSKMVTSNMVSDPKGKSLFEIMSANVKATFQRRDPVKCFDRNFDNYRPKRAPLAEVMSSKVTDEAPRGYTLQN